MFNHGNKADGIRIEAYYGSQVTVDIVDNTFADIEEAVMRFLAYADSTIQWSESGNDYSQVSPDAEKVVKDTDGSSQVNP